MASEETAIGKRRDEIKVRIKDVANVAGNKTNRVVLPAGIYGAWDRQIQHRGEGLDTSKLEEIMGTDSYRKACCIRQVHYVPVSEKIEEAQRVGKITDEMFDFAYHKGKRTEVLKKLSAAQFGKMQKKA